METIPARLMRPQAEACRSKPPLTERQRNRRTYILEAARAIFLTHGRTRVQLRDVAIATGVTQLAIRNMFADLDHLFALTLHNYLDEILRAVGAVPTNRPNLHARRRAEYLRVTRGICNVPTPMHFLWMRERFTLPDDELESIELARRTIGHLLAGEHWETALLLLDSHHLEEPQIEAMLATHAAPAQQQTPEPEPPAARPATPEPARAKTPRPHHAPQHLPAQPPAHLSWLAAQPPPHPPAQAA